MARTSLVHYISPSAITIIPNCNRSADDIAVQVAAGTKIRVYSKAVGLDLVNATYQEWTLKGRNRRLLGTATNCRYTIFARLSKANVADGYIVFTPMTEEMQEDGTTVGRDKYWHVTTEGYSHYEDNRLDEDFDPADPTLPDDQRDYWWFRIGWVTKPNGNLRSVYLDTAILGTDATAVSAACFARSTHAANPADTRLSTSAAPFSAERADRKAMSFAIISAATHANISVGTASIATATEMCERRFI